MSAEAATVPTQAEEAGEAHALAFRIAFAAAVGLTLGEVLGWDFPFLPAMLAVQLLGGRGPLSVKQGVGFVAVMVAACAFAVLLAQILVDRPLVLLLSVFLLIFLEFLLLARGQAAGVAAIFLITTAVVPLLAIESMSVAYGLIHSLIAGGALAVLLAFAAHALFPTRAHAEPVSAPAQKSNPATVALANTAVLMSLVIYFMLTVSPVSIVVVLTVIGILRQPADLSGDTAAGLILGNLFGGLAATAAYILVTLLPSRPFFCLSPYWSGLSLATVSRALESRRRSTPSASRLFSSCWALDSRPCRRTAAHSSLPASSTSWWRPSTPSAWPACCTRRFAPADYSASIAHYGAVAGLDRQNGRKDVGEISDQIAGGPLIGGSLGCVPCFI